MPELDLLGSNEHGTQRTSLPHHPAIVKPRELERPDRGRTRYGHARQTLRDVQQRDLDDRSRVRKVELAEPRLVADALHAPGEGLLFARAKTDLPVVVR